MYSLQLTRLYGTIRYEKQYMEEIKLKEAEQKNEDDTKQTSVVGGNDKEEGTEKNLSSKSSSAEHDLDTFLLGDLEDSDGGPGIQPILLSCYLWSSSRIQCHCDGSLVRA